jgi:hypothetical protein
LDKVPKRSDQFVCNEKEVAGRLRLLRTLISGDDQTAFAASLGIGIKRWNNFERGYPLSKEIAILLARSFPGLTLDWLLLGRADGMPLRLQRELEEVSRA